jgi:hypothetical protein
MVTLIQNLFRGRSPLLLATVLAVTLAGAALAAYSFAYDQPHQGLGDSYWVSHGAENIISCLRAGIHSHCDLHDTGVRTGLVAEGVGPYPPPQYIVAIVVQQIFGASIQGTFQWFSRLNALAFLGLLVLSIRLGIRMNRAWAPPLFVVLALTSPLTYYTYLTFGEPLMTFLVAYMAYAALLRKHWALLAISAFAATLTKETVFPFTMAIALTCLWATPLSTRALTKRDWFAVGGGVIAGALFHVGFDWFRYGVLYNADYTNPNFVVHNFTIWWKYTVSVLFAPNGGLLPFWPTASLVLLLGLVFSVRAFRLDRRAVKIWLPGVLLVGIQIAQAVTLGRWWSPFGWIAWGPRLQLSLIPASLFLAIVVYADQIQSVVAWFAARNWRRDLLLLCGAVAAIPSTAGIFYPQAMDHMWNVIPAGTVCSAPGGPPNPNYYNCNVWHSWRQAWEERWILLDAFHGVWTTTGLFAVLAVVVGTAACIVVMMSATAPKPTPNALATEPDGTAPPAPLAATAVGQ